MSTADLHTFHRPSREWPPPVPTEQLRIAAPPTVPTPPQHGLLQALMPLVGGVGLFGFSIVYGNSTFLFIAGAMMLLMLAFSIGMRASQSRAIRRRGAQEARRYASYLRERDAELAEAGDRQRKALGRLYPEPGALWTAMVKRQGVWERRPNHRDFLHVRIGTGAVELDRPVELDTGVNPLTEYQPVPMREARKMVERRTRLRGQPVVVDLGEIGVLAVTGERERSRAWARSLMVQLAAFRAPHDLHLVTAFEPEATTSWEWAKWLPHQRVEQPAGGDRAPVPAVALARDAAELDALLEAELRPRLEQLRRMAESNVTGRDAMLAAPELVLIVDGYAPGHPANELPAFRELLDRAREVRAVVVLLVDARDLEPSHVDARLGIPERGNATFERTGPDAPTIPDLAPDAADVGTSEAIARTLTPLRLAEGGDGERALGDTVKLSDLIGPEPSQAKRPRSASLRVPFGISAEGEVAILDLKQAAEGGMGPHGILVGATGSGKSELLRSLVAGLAATHDPETLSFVLVDYKGGAAFAELARLPHVAGMITNLQRDLSLVDRMHDALLGEQERRQTMLREAGNLDDAIAYRAKREHDRSLPPMPDLLVIVDEFAEMLTAKPEFIDLFVGIGRVGRSLGIHLLLSSQRLDEGRLRGLESHLRYRICLRTYSAPESKMVLGTPDAYLLPSLPGLGYLKVDTSVYEQFRAALVTSRPAVPSSARRVRRRPRCARSTPRGRSSASRRPRPGPPVPRRLPSAPTSTSSSTAWRAAATPSRSIRCGSRRCPRRWPSTRCSTSRRGGTAGRPPGSERPSAASTARASSAPRRFRWTSAARAAMSPSWARRAPASRRCCEPSARRSYSATRRPRRDSTRSTWAAACSARCRAPRTSAASSASSTARRSGGSSPSCAPRSRSARSASARCGSSPWTRRERTAPPTRTAVSPTCSCSSTAGTPSSASSRASTARSRSSPRRAWRSGCTSW